MVDVQTISVVIAATSVVIAAVTLTQQSREANRTRQDELFMSIYSRYQEKEYWMHYLDAVFNWEFKDYDDFMEKYGWTKNLEDYASFLTVGGFYHVVGVLLMRKQIDPTLVHTLIPYSPIRFWEKMEAVIKEWRKNWNQPKFSQGVEYLSNEMERMNLLETTSR